MVGAGTDFPNGFIGVMTLPYGNECSGIGGGKSFEVVYAGGAD